jgi:hypothetical protein
VESSDGRCRIVVHTHDLETALGTCKCKLNQTMLLNNNARFGGKMLLEEGVAHDNTNTADLSCFVAPKAGVGVGKSVFKGLGSGGGGVGFL